MPAIPFIHGEYAVVYHVENHNGLPYGMTTGSSRLARACAQEPVWGLRGELLVRLPFFGSSSLPGLVHARFNHRPPPHPRRSLWLPGNASPQDRAPRQRGVSGQAVLFFRAQNWSGCSVKNGRQSAIRSGFEKRDTRSGYILRQLGLGRRTLLIRCLHVRGKRDSVLRIPTWW